YGVTDEGGLYGKGVVYRIREDGTGFQVLHSFGGKDGAYPLLVELVEGSGGWLYGVTSGGGVYGNGVVFGVKEDGSGYRVLHEFSAEDGLGRNGDGSHPYGGLVLGLGGWLYGETYGGGVYGNGVVFGVREDGSGYRVLHAFSGRDGRWGMGRLVWKGGKLYGVTYGGGRDRSGVVYVLGEDGRGYQVLHDFGKGAVGLCPYGLLSVGRDGWLYGVTEGGGVGGQGVVYRLRADGSGFGVVYDFGKRQKPVSSR
ncbi:MAG TPA: choice-of-anchor tandem repeat GloVer-containing protein, partial [Chthonomonas sp.]|uniref:choice-of-anchor tandem repeat GloVer-containing protein n=1 Tax=Chthonomonas sp. TaxID=2282153 RepID=UPI002B4B060F